MLIELNVGLRWLCELTIEEYCEDLVENEHALPLTTFSSLGQFLKDTE